MYMNDFVVYDIMLFNGSDKGVHKPVKPRKDDYIRISKFDQNPLR